MDRCPNCKEEVAPELDSCKFCQAPLYKACPSCRERIRAEAIKCRFCQADFNAPSPAVAQKSSELVKLESDSTLAMILGIVGITVFHLAAPFAWYVGRKTNKRLAQLGQPQNSQATLGTILGIIATILMGLGLLIVFGVIAIAILAAIFSH